MDTHEVLSPTLKTKAAEEPKGNRALILLTACCGVFAGFGSLFIYTFGVFLKPLAVEFGWSRSQISSGFMGAVLAIALCSPLLGRLFDRYPARRVVLPCFLLYAGSFASLAWLTPHLWHFVAVLIFMGAVGNGTTQLGYARFVSGWFDRSRGRALAAVMAGSGVGSIVFPPLAQWLISHYGWRTAYASLGILALLVGLPLAFTYLHEAPMAKPQPIQNEAAQPGLWQAILSFRFLGILLALLLFSLATNGLNAHWAALLTDHGFTPATAAAVLSVAGFATLGSKLGTGYLLDRFSGQYTAAVLFLLSGAGILTVTYGQTQPVAFVAAALVGVGMGAESDAVPYLLTRYFGLRRFSELYGYTWSIYAVAGGLGPLLAGAVFDRTHSYRLALLLFSSLVIAAAVLFAALPKYQRPNLTYD